MQNVQIACLEKFNIHIYVFHYIIKAFTRTFIKTIGILLKTATGYFNILLYTKC